MPAITYTVCDLDVILPNGATARIEEGQIEVDYDLQDAEPDVGISEGYAADFTIEGGQVEIAFIDEDRANIALVLTAGHPILAQIAKAEKNDIEQACMDEAAEDWWTCR
jgi:hypothetical protein